jgi:predicted Zn-dependent protease
MSHLDESIISGRLGDLIADARYGEALQLIEVTVQAGSGDAWLYGMRALLLLETGDTTGALHASATAVHEAPQAAFAHWTRGVVLLRANILPGAQRAAEQAVALDAEEPDTHVLLARVYLQKSMWEQARMAIADADSHGADDEELLPLRAAIAAGRGLDARASETWRVFAQRYPANALARTGHAWTMLEAGDVRGAHSEFQQARELDPTNTWAMEGLVVTQTKLQPVHRRWVSGLWGRLMHDREEAMVAIGAVLTTIGLTLLLLPQTGIVPGLAITLCGAGLPMLDAWRQDNVAN